MKEIFKNDDTIETKITRLKRLVDSPEFIKIYFTSVQFLDNFIPFAVQVLSIVEPEKKGPLGVKNDARYTILRTLNRVNVKGVYNKELIQVLCRTMQCDNLPNIILSINVLSSIEKNRVFSVDLFEHYMGIFLGVFYEILGSIEGSDESHVEISLIALNSIIIQMGSVFIKQKEQSSKVEQFINCTYAYLRKSLIENRRFFEFILHKKVIAIEICSLIKSLMQVTYDALDLLPKSAQYTSLLPDIGYLAIFYCPPDCFKLRDDICKYFKELCINNKDVFIPIIDRLYMMPFMFSADYVHVNVNAIYMLSDIMNSFSDNLSKTSYLDFSYKISEIIIFLCNGLENRDFSITYNNNDHKEFELTNTLLNETNKIFNGINLDEVEITHNFYIDNIRKCLGTLEKVSRIYSARPLEDSEISEFCCRRIYDIHIVFSTLYEVYSTIDPPLVKKLMTSFISSFSQVLGRVNLLEKMSPGFIVFGSSEMYKLYEIFSKSFKILNYINDYNCIEEFFSVILRLSETISSDVIKENSNNIIEYSRINRLFFSVWKILTGSIAIGNLFIMNILPRLYLLRDSEIPFIIEAMHYVIPFFNNDFKKMKRINTYYMHKFITTYMNSSAKELHRFNVVLEIFTIFNSTQEKSPFFQKYIYNNFVTVVRHLVKCYKVDNNPMFIEMIFKLPVSVNLVENDIQFIIEPIAEALKIGGSVGTRALTFITYIIDFCTYSPEWVSIVNSLEDYIKDPNTTVLATKIYGKLKTFHKEMIYDKEIKEDSSPNKVINFVIDEEYLISVHEMFYDAVENVTGKFIEDSCLIYGGNDNFIRFRVTKKNSTVDNTMLLNSYNFITSIVSKILGWEFYKEGYIRERSKKHVDSIKNEENTLRASEYVFSIDAAIAGLSNSKYSTTIALSQYLYDSIIALFNFYDTDLEGKAQSILTNIYNTFIYYKLVNFYRLNRKGTKILLNDDTFISALSEAFKDINNPMPYKIIALLFNNTHDLLGKISESMCFEMFKVFIFIFEFYCSSSDIRIRNAGLNGVLCLVTSSTVESLVMHKLLEDTFVCIYTYLRPSTFEEGYDLPLRLALYTLRLRYRSICSYIKSKNSSNKVKLNIFTPFVNGLLNNKKHIVEYSKIVLSEVLLNHHSDLLLEHSDKIFEYLKNKESSDLCIALGVFVFCCNYGKQPFNEIQMRFLLDKFISLSESVKISSDNYYLECNKYRAINSKQICSGFDTCEDYDIANDNIVDDNKNSCLISKYLSNIIDLNSTNEKISNNNLCILLNDKFIRVTNLSVKDLINIALNGNTELYCIKCRKRAFKPLFEKVPLKEELNVWVRELHLLVITYSDVEEEKVTSILYLLNSPMGINIKYLEKAFSIDSVLFSKVMHNELELAVDGKTKDHKKIVTLLNIYGILDLDMELAQRLITKILKDYKNDKEYKIIAQDSTFSVLAAALELGLIKGHSKLVNDIMETYIILDDRIKSYTLLIKPRVLKFISIHIDNFLNFVYRKIHENSVYNLCKYYFESIKNGKTNNSIDNNSIDNNSIDSNSIDNNNFIGNTEGYICQLNNNFVNIYIKNKNSINNNIITTFASRITEGYFNIDHSMPVDYVAFINAYKLLELLDYELTYKDLKAAISLYSDLRIRFKNTIELRELFTKYISKFNTECYEALYKIDPLFIAYNSIPVDKFISDISPITLKYMLKSIKRNDVNKNNNADRLIEVFNDNSHLLIELFVNLNINSPRLIKYCRDSLNNPSIRGVLMYYLCTFEPTFLNFEILFKMPYEDRRFTLYSLNKVVSSLDPTSFEELTIIVLRSEVRFKTTIYILFPLLLNKPVLITKRVAYELLGCICRLLNNEKNISNAIDLFRAIYNKFVFNNKDVDVEFMESMRNVYTLSINTLLGSSIDVQIDVFKDYGFLLDFNSFIVERRNINNLFTYLEVEVSSNKPEDYKKRLLSMCKENIMQNLYSRNVSCTFIKYLIFSGVWENITISENFNKELLHNLYFVFIYYKQMLGDSCIIDINERLEYISNILIILKDNPFCTTPSNNTNNISNTSNCNNNSCCINYKIKGIGNKNEDKKDCFSRIRRMLDELILLLSLDSNIKKYNSVLNVFKSILKNCSVIVPLIVERLFFVVNDNRVSLSDKLELLLLLKDCKYKFNGITEDVLGRLALPVFKNYRDMDYLTVIQELFIYGLNSIDKNIRNAYYDLFNESVPKNKKERLIYLLSFDWKESKMVGYSIIRMMLASFSTLNIKTSICFRCLTDLEYDYPWEAQQLSLTVNDNTSNEKYLKLTQDFFDEVDLTEANIEVNDYIENMYYFSNTSKLIVSLLKFIVKDFTEEENLEVLSYLYHFSKNSKDDKVLDYLIRGLCDIIKFVSSKSMNIINTDTNLNYNVSSNSKNNINTDTNLNYNVSSNSKNNINIDNTNLNYNITELIYEKGGITWFSLLEYLNLTDKVKIYKKLGYLNYYYGGCRNISKYPETMQAITLQQLGEIKEGQKMLEVVQKKAINKCISFDVDEYNLWKDEWITSARQLQEWDICYDLGIYTGDISLSAESMWYISDFNNMNDVENFRNLLNLKDVSLEKQLFSAFLDDYDQSKIEGLLNIATETLKSYPLNAPVSGKCLLNIQMIVELLEMENIFTGKIDTLDSLNTMIFRLNNKEPFKNDNFNVWNLYTYWRIHAFKKLSVYPSLEPEEGNAIRIKGVNEMAKAYNKLSEVAIENKYYDLALFNLKEVFNLSSIKVRDAFEKVIFELKCYLEKGEYKLALDLANSTNLQHFNEQQCSMLFSFRGLLNEKLGKNGEAEKLYLNSIQICNTVGSSWLNWGTYLMNNVNNVPGLEKEAFLALLQAVSHCTYDKAYEAIIKMLNMMKVYNDICDRELFTKILQLTDVSKFIFFIPQLFELFENNSDLISIIIKFIWKEYPQAILNPLRVARNIYRGGKNNSNMKNMNLNVLRNTKVKSVMHTPDTSPNKEIQSKEIQSKEIQSKEIQRDTLNKESPNKEILRDTLNKVAPVNISPTTINNNIDSLINDGSILNDLIIRNNKDYNNRVVEIMEKLYNDLKDHTYKRENAMILIYISKLYGHYCFKDEDYLNRHLQIILDRAQSHIFNGTTYPMKEQKLLINGLISYSSSSSLSEELKNKFKDAILKIKTLCPLENIDEFMKLKKHLNYAVKGSYLKINETCEHIINIMLNQSTFEHKMFGQYSEIRSNYKSLVNIEHLEPAWTYIYRRRLGQFNFHIRGSDGKAYRYEIRSVLETRHSELILSQLSVYINQRLKNINYESKLQLETFQPIVLDEGFIVEKIDDNSHSINDIIDNALFDYGISLEQFILVYLNNFAKIYDKEINNFMDLTELENFKNTPSVNSTESSENNVCANSIHSKSNLSTNVKEIKNTLLEQRKKYLNNYDSIDNLCLCCPKKYTTPIIPQCSYKYEVLNNKKFKTYKKMRNLLKLDESLKNYMKDLFDNPASYFTFKHNALNTYSANTAFLYSFFILDRRPQNLIISKKKGNFMSKRLISQRYSSMNNSSQPIISPIYQEYFTKEGIEGPLLTITYKYFSLLEDPLYKEVLKLFIEKDCKSLFNVEFGEFLEAFNTRVKNTCAKDGDGFNIVNLISEWMDVRRLSQADPYNLPWV